MILATFSVVEGWMTAAIVVLLFVLVVLAVAETSLNRVSKVKAHALEEELGTRSATALARLVENPETFINPLLVTVTVAQTAQAFLTSIVADRVFGTTGVIAAFVLNVVVFFVLSEALPKTWAILSPERTALLTARPTAALVGFAPLRLVSRGLIGLANILIPGKGLKKGPFVSEQELLGFVEAAAEEDVIEHEERELIESIIEFGDTVAREIMVPRPDMVTVPVAATATSALDIAIEHGYSRLPVVGETIDDVLGIIYTKDLARAERTGQGDAPVADLARPARFVPETKPVSRLMREMQADKIHMAILVDEYGGIAGLVTLEDCIEELVGEINDEYDTEEPDVERLDDGELRVDGGYGIHDLAELLERNLPDDDWDTVGGFVFGMLGHVPTAGESIEYEGHRFTAEKVEGRRVACVLVQPLPDASGATALAQSS